MKPQDFIDAIQGAAVAAAAACGIPAGFTIAEAALESGWGESGLVLHANNLFGVKADKSWEGPTVSIPTKEHIDGQDVMIPAHWRKYDSWQACIDDHAQFLEGNERYKEAFKVPPLGCKAFASVIAAAGYATDPDYAKKLCAVIKAHKLDSLDAQHEML